MQELKRVLLVFGSLLVVTGFSLANPLLGLGTLILLAIGMLIRHRVRLALFVIAFLIPFDPQFEVSGKFVPLDLLFLTLAVPVIWYMMTRNLRMGRIAFFLVPYIIFAIATTAWRAENPFWFWASCVRLLTVVFVAAAVSWADSAEFTIIPLGLTLPPLLLYGLYQLQIDDFGSLYMLINPHHEDQPWLGRAYALFLHPNAYGGFCVVVSVMLVAFALRTPNSFRRNLSLLCAACGFVGSMSSGSRGSWIAAIAGLLTIFALGRSRLRSKILLVSALLFVVLLASALPYLPLKRGESLDDFTVETRTTVYLTALLLFLEHPVIGIGMTNFQEVLPTAIQWDNPIIHAHNIYLQILAEDGIVGFLLYYLPIFYLMYRSLQSARGSATALMASAGLVVICVHGLFDNLLYSNPQYLMLVAFVFGLSVKVSSQWRVKEVPESEFVGTGHLLEKPATL
jgi:putative inorganic carbon (HCO3(-)) transporter